MKNQIKKRDLSKNTKAWKRSAKLHPKTNLISIGFFLSIAALPIYIFASGGVQPAHILIFLSCCLFILHKGFRVDRFSIILLILFAYVLTRESLAMMLAGYDWDTLLPATYILFNFVVFTVMRDWLERTPATGSFFSWGIIISLLVAIAGVAVLGYSLQISAGTNLRAVGTFNNPNQLGYFSVATASIIALMFLDNIISMRYFAGATAACIFLSILSLSKAAMISVAFVLPLLVSSFVAVRQRIRLKHLIAALIICIGMGLIAGNSDWIDQYKFYNRIADIGSDADDSLKGRGYFAISHFNTWEWVFGMGTDRTAEVVGHEVHSTVWSFFVNYGLIGFALFVSFLIIWIKKIYEKHSYIGLMVIIAPSMLYGLTHNGSRFTIFWLLLAFSFVSVKSNAAKSSKAR